MPEIADDREITASGQFPRWLRSWLLPGSLPLESQRQWGPEIPDCILVLRVCRRHFSAPLWSYRPPGITKYVPPVKKSLVRAYQCGKHVVQQPQMVLGLMRSQLRVQRRKDNRLDAEIEVPDSMFFVITPCAICGGQFYVTTLEAPWMREYTCPDCQRLRLCTGTSAGRRQTDAASL